MTRDIFSGGLDDIFESDYPEGYDDEGEEILDGGVEEPIKAEVVNNTAIIRKPLTAMMKSKNIKQIVVLKRDGTKIYFS